MEQASSILSLVALLVAAVAVGYSALTRTTIATLKESNAAYEQRISILEGEVSRSVESSQQDQRTIQTLTSERDTLAKVVTGEAHLVVIEERLSDALGQLGTHHQEATQWWADLAQILQGIRSALEAPA